MLVTPLDVSSNALPHQEVVEMIIQEAERQNYQDPLLALSIAKAESGFDPKAKNKTSSATGVFQIINSTFKKNCEGSVWTAQDNVRCGILLLKRDGHSHWDESVKYWLRPYTQSYIRFSQLQFAEWF